MGVFGGFTVRGVESAEQRGVQACAEIAGTETELGGVFLATEPASVRLRAVSRGVRYSVGVIVGRLYGFPGNGVHHTDDVPLVVVDVHVVVTPGVDVPSLDLNAVRTSVGELMASADVAPAECRPVFVGKLLRQLLACRGIGVADLLTGTE